MVRTFFVVMMAFFVVGLVGCSSPEKRAAEADAEIAELHRLLFVESNPIPVKWAVSQMGFGEINMRLPMTVLAEEYRQPLREALVACGAL